MPPQQAQSEYDDPRISGDETEKFRPEDSKLPDSSTLDDYHRVPVGRFGLELLKGMGWQEGTSTNFGQGSLAGLISGGLLNYGSMYMVRFNVFF
ncbi:hypothetical protein O181_110121 [Austropuccinia psidii MF-1]|uniref:Spp2/MOS2 G-patch domain-containing protein n=1 Tax=Austropuccinia psidii MF-1 TaxID=1389203 RepID=A0A9Q3JXZ8_9BASI|nr:hypothetical protein [Austropuccinia psidii MF-1]